MKKGHDADEAIESTAQRVIIRIHEADGVVVHGREPDGQRVRLAVGPFIVRRGRARAHAGHGGQREEQEQEQEQEPEQASPGVRRPRRFGRLGGRFRRRGRR